MIKNNDFISFRAITDNVSVAFALTLRAKSRISVNPIQAWVWTIRYIFPALCRKAWGTFRKMSLFEYRKAKKKVPENGRFSLLFKVEIRIKTKNEKADIIKQKHGKADRGKKSSNERVQPIGHKAGSG